MIVISYQQRAMPLDPRKTGPQSSHGQRQAYSLFGIEKSGP
jgi:hypothetical protein